MSVSSLTLGKKNRLRTHNEVQRLMRSAIQEGRAIEVASLLAEDPARTRIMTPFGSWLHIAAKAGRREIVELLINQGIDIDQRGGTFDGAAINLAAGYGQLDVVRLLLAKGAALDVSEPERNPLFSAIHGGHFEVVQTLIEAGIDYSVRYTGPSMRDMDAHAYAAERGCSAIADYLDSLPRNENHGA